MMTFLHKLAQRLARLWVSLVIGLLVILSCELPSARLTSPPDAVAKLEVSPSNLSVQPDRTTDLAVVALTADDDTVDALVSWTTTGGSVAPMSDVVGRARALQGASAARQVQSPGPGQRRRRRGLSVCRRQHGDGFVRDREPSIRKSDDGTDGSDERDAARFERQRTVRARRNVGE
jgi:hypothetical protein